MMHFFGFKKMKVWIISSRNFETVVAATDAVEAVEVFYIYHPKERGDVWEMCEAEFNLAGMSGRENRGSYIGKKFHGYIFIRESPDELWVRSKPKVLYTHMDVKAPMGIARQGGEGVMIYMSKIQLKMLDHVIDEVMPGDTRSKMAARMITMLHQFLDGSISRLPVNWNEAQRKLTGIVSVPRLEKWDPPEQVEMGCDFAVPNSITIGRTVTEGGWQPLAEHCLDVLKKHEIVEADNTLEEIKPLIEGPAGPDFAKFEANIKKEMLLCERGPVVKVLDDIDTLKCECGGFIDFTNKDHTGDVNYCQCQAEGEGTTGDINALHPIPCKKCGGLPEYILGNVLNGLQYQLKCCKKGIQCAGGNRDASIEMWNRMNSTKDYRESQRKHVRDKLKEFNEGENLD